LGRTVSIIENVVDDKFYHADVNGVLTVMDVSTKSGWQFFGDYWYYFKDGSVLKDTFEIINGSKYHFESDGKMTIGRFRIDEMYYLAEPDGQIVTARGWYQSKQSGKRYWFDENGDVAGNDLLTIGGQKYYFDGEGIMQTGAFWANYLEDHQWVSKKLFANASGTIITTPGWQSQGGTWYYVKANGEAAINELIEINGSSYYFNHGGAMQTGLIRTYVNDKWHSYIANASGAIVKGGWIKEGFAWYYTDADGNVCTNKWIGNCYVTSDGIMAVGEKKIDGKTYVFDENGYKQMVIGEQSGWTLADGTWYYCTAKGEPYNGWLDHTYYIENGRMRTDAAVPSEHYNSAHDYSYVGADGAVASGWVKSLDGWNYAEKNAATGDPVLVENGWRKIGNTWYYFRYMRMVSGTITEVDGKLSQFAASGAWRGYVSGTGWKQTAFGDWYYVNADGMLNTESKKEIGGLTYYFNDGGMMHKNAPFYDKKTGKYFWINANGNRDTKDGWKLSDDGIWYYVENDSLVGEGEKVVSGAVYHFDADGSMTIGMEYESENDKYYIYGANGGKTEATSGWYSATVYGKTVWYYFKNGLPYDGFVGSYYIEYGRMLTGLVYSRDSGVYMFDENGRLFTGGWIYHQGAWYYAGKTGRIYTGDWNIGGRRYIFNRNGEWVK